MDGDPVGNPSIRVFLALPLGALFCDELGRILPWLREAVPGVRWVEPGQVHLTLHFFGSIPASETGRINTSMQNIALNFSPLSLKMDKLGAFPGLKRPNIIWFGVEESGKQLLFFQDAVQNEIRRLGFEVESRPFHPHVTVGRVKKTVRDLDRLTEKIPFRFPTPEKTADHFVLYQSHCFPEGARYEVLKTYPFSKKA